ncbi:hypothetical protein LMG30237_ALEAABJJ_00304 [Fructobacillus tropaeoli]|uniref:hypothetical protein n=1 Tax=Fructobacillus tropaeoli TaxID=709323 RepID=UPI002DAB1A7A|nr:hypothetical protein LMG30237_ALEAABJJ_00304 [Fructobacillus tropaeoli]
MKSLSKFLHKLLHHPNTLAWVFPIVMVAIMSTYNTVIRFGFSEKKLERVWLMYPVIVVFIYCLRTFVTLPITMRLHKHYPKFIKNHLSESYTVPLTVMMLNVSIMMLWLTEMYHRLYPQFLPGYLMNWVKTFFVAVPIFFLIVRPIILAIFDYLRNRFPVEPLIEKMEDTLETGHRA